jgi:formamidopyrimidine-DNA glycosylase
VAGIGNIYSDEILWASNIHPLTIVSRIPESKIKTLWKNTKILLTKGIDFGGDSMSDYRNIDGLRGQFQYHHKAYRQKNKPCPKKGCKGSIERIVVGGRSTHYCPIHQILI